MPAYHRTEGLVRVAPAYRGKPVLTAEQIEDVVARHDRYWIVEVHYAKADPTDLLMTVEVTNAGPEADVVHVLPTLWFRNTWSWEDAPHRPSLRAHDDAT